jgi:hypothetical protein
MPVFPDARDQPPLARPWMMTAPSLLAAAPLSSEFYPATVTGSFLMVAWFAGHPPHGLADRPSPLRGLRALHAAFTPSGCDVVHWTTSSQEFAAAFSKNSRKRPSVRFAGESVFTTVVVKCRKRPKRSRTREAAGKPKGAAFRATLTTLQAASVRRILRHQRPALRGSASKWSQRRGAKSVEPFA